MGVISQVRTFAANMDAVPEMMGFVSGLCAGLPEQAVFDMTLACEEIFVNIASYAYPDGEGELTLRWSDDAEKRRLTLVFEDSGVPFDPLQKEEPNLSVPFQERKIGGLGIMMVRQRMDCVRYAYRDGKNVLTIENGY